MTVPTNPTWKDFEPHVVYTEVEEICFYCSSCEEAEEWFRRENTVDAIVKIAHEPNRDSRK